MTGLYDSFQRQINYLRISITDFCNLNCVYCSEGSVPRLSRDEILRYEEIRRLIVIAASMGINKVRLTGGEPLLRPDLTRLVHMIAGTPGIDDIALTTNGTLLGTFAVELKEAGLTRVNVSLDTLRGDRFKTITGNDKLADVLAGIDLARRVGLTPVKVNMVVMRGTNDDEVMDFALKVVHDGWDVRYIEYMPFGGSDAEFSRMVSSHEIMERLRVLGPLEPCGTEIGNGPARYFRLPGANGTIGFISPITEHFCSTCNRLRITADGHLRPCLLDDDEIDIKEALRSSVSDDELRSLIERAVTVKRERHHLNEGEQAPERPMRQIGG
jgi:cyclic pyranopterin phosphate synthase